LSVTATVDDIQTTIKEADHGGLALDFTIYVIICIREVDLPQ